MLPADPGDTWVREPGRTSPEASPRRPDRRSTVKVPVEVDESQLTGLTPAARSRFLASLGAAAAAYEAERYSEARTALARLARSHSGVAEVRELHGLVLYRLGRWSEAIHELEAFSSASQSVEQHPVLMDCHRALGHGAEVERLWSELREASPSAALVTEGRIVAAGRLADDGDVAAAIRLLEAGPVRTRRPAEHHLRLWFALADLYERVGDSARARRGFERISSVDPELPGVRERLRSFG
jgi:tetratricopeptide (TPR) repeat protein